MAPPITKASVFMGPGRLVMTNKLQVIFAIQSSICIFPVEATGQEIDWISSQYFNQFWEHLQNLFKSNLRRNCGIDHKGNKCVVNFVNIKLRSHYDYVFFRRIRIVYGDNNPLSSTTVPSQSK